MSFQLALLAMLDLMMKDTPDRVVAIGGFAIADCDGQSASRRIQAYVYSGSQIAVFFANTHFVVSCQPLREKLRRWSSVLILNDGIGLSLARRALRKGSFSENLNGTDFIPRLLRESPRFLRIYLLGASKASVEGAAVAFDKISQVTVVGKCDGFSFWSRQEEVIDEINLVKPDILLVALGCPLQENWILENAPRLKVPAIFGVGALFDFVSGTHMRAPDYMRQAGLEWLYRLWREPRRLAYRYTIEIFSFFQIVLADVSR